MSAASQPLHEAQPRDRRAYSNLRHGLTGRIYLFGEDEQKAFDDLRRSLFDAWAPADERQASLVAEITDDTWRLSRAATFESALFAEQAEKFVASEEATGDAAVDLALGHSRAWLAEAKNINLLSLYSSRVHRRRERNTAELRRLQNERQQALDAAIEEAAYVSYMAESKGEEWDPAEAFQFRGFEFSAEEIRRMIDRFFRLLEARNAFRASKIGRKKAA